MPENNNGSGPPEHGVAAATEEAQRGPDGRWQKGQSGNPAGAPPKVRSFTAALEGVSDKDELANIIWDIASGKTKATVQVQLDAAKYIYARIEGNPLQALRHSTDGTIQPMIFLHPGRDTPAPPPETASDSPDNTSRCTPEA